MLTSVLVHCKNCSNKLVVRQGSSCPCGCLWLSRPSLSSVGESGESRHCDRRELVSVSSTARHIRAKFKQVPMRAPSARMMPDDAKWCQMMPDDARWHDLTWLDVNREILHSPHPTSQAATAGAMGVAMARRKSVWTRARFTIASEGLCSFNVFPVQISYYCIYFP